MTRKPRDTRDEPEAWNSLAEHSIGHSNANTYTGTWTAVTPATASSQFDTRHSDCSSHYTFPTGRGMQ